LYFDPQVTMKLSYQSATEGDVEASALLHDGSPRESGDDIVINRKIFKLGVVAVILLFALMAWGGTASGSAVSAVHDMDTMRTERFSGTSNYYNRFNSKTETGQWPGATAMTHAYCDAGDTLDNISKCICANDQGYDTRHPSWQKQFTANDGRIGVECGCTSVFIAATLRPTLRILCKKG